MIKKIIGGFIRPMMDYGQGGGDPGAPPGPPAAPPPGPYSPPPGPFGPTGQGPGPYAVGPRPDSSSTWKYLLIGCLGLLVLGGIIGVGTCYYAYQKAPGLVAGGLQLGKGEFVKLLTPDHADEDIDRFKQDYDGLTEELERLGTIKWAMEYGEIYDELTNISADNIITLDESDEWCGNVEDALDAHDYYAD